MERAVGTAAVVSRQSAWNQNHLLSTSVINANLEAKSSTRSSPNMFEDQCWQWIRVLGGYLITPGGNFKGRIQSACPNQG